VTSVAWGATPTVTGTAAAPDCRTTPSACGPFTASSSSGLSVVYFDVWNTGAVALTGLSYSVSIPGGSFSLLACSVAWSANGNCSGTTTKLLHKVSAGTYPATAALPVSAGSVVYLQLIPSPAATSVTVSTSVCSGGTTCTDGTTARQIRAAAVTDS
jgi:hypothetical protein